MAILIPSNRDYNEFSNSIGELQLYENFQKLSDDYIIFHSVEWMKKSKYVQFGEADYIIFNKKRGIICLEVKHGGIRGDNGRIFQENRQTKEQFVIDPMGQADRSKYYFLKKLRSVYNRYKIEYPIHSVVWLTGIDYQDLQGELPHNYSLNKNTFLNDDIKDINSTFNKIFDFFNMDEIKVSQLISNKVRDVLLPEFQALPSLQNIIDLNDYTFNRMTKEQNYLLDYLDEQKTAAIQGGAGTGKTLLALEKARRLSENENVVFLCFNSLLISTLQKRYSEELPNVTFTNLYSLTAKAYGRSVTKDDIIHFLKGFDNYPSVWKYNSIIIDEGQDFSNEQINLLKDISILNEGHLYIFYDKHQLVQQRNELEWLNEMECRLVLSYNCRNTYNIAKTSMYSIGVSDIKMRLNVEGEMPLYHNSVNKKELIRWLESRIKSYLSQGVSWDQIVILTTQTIEKSILNGVSNIGRYEISSSHNQDSILFTTARKFKGLEADIIFIVDLNSSHFENDEDKRVFYVAASRAKTVLELAPVLNQREEEKLFEGVSKGNSKGIASLLRYLNVKPI